MKEKIKPLKTVFLFNTVNGEWEFWMWFESADRRRWASIHVATLNVERISRCA